MLPCFCLQVQTVLGFVANLFDAVQPRFLIKHFWQGLLAGVFLVSTLRNDKASIQVRKGVWHKQMRRTKSWNGAPTFAKIILTRRLPFHFKRKTCWFFHSVRATTGPAWLKRVQRVSKSARLLVFVDRVHLVLRKLDFFQV